MKRIITTAFFIFLMVTAFSVDFVLSEQDCVLKIKKEMPQDKKVVTTVSLIFYPDIIDTSIVYIRGIAGAFKGGIVKDNPDTMIITILKDSLDRAFYFLDKLGTIKKKKVIKANETKNYIETKEILAPLVKERDVYMKELREAEEHPDAVAAENKILPLNEKIHPLINEINRIDFGSKYTYITIYIKQE